MHNNTPVLNSTASDISLLQFMDHSGDVFWLADLRSGQLLYVTPQVAQLWGISADELIDDPQLWNGAVDPQDAQLLPRPFFADTTDTERAVREYRIADHEGQTHWIRDRRFYFYDQGGQLTRVGGIAEDVSERRQHEDRQQEFLAMATHELRSPLNAMRGWTHVLRRAGALNPLQEKALEAIDRSTRTQVRLMDDLLDQQRILQGDIELQWARTDLPALLEETVAAAQEEAQARHIKLEVRQDRSIGLISADTHRLRQALAILLSNAIKLTPDNGSILISTRHGPNALFIDMHDGSAGTLPGEPPSTRLSLHMARQVIALHGGQIRKRRDGRRQGGTLSIELPDKLLQASPSPLPDMV